MQMHGGPGSGKSTVASALASRTGAVVLDKDVIKSALLDGGASWERASSGAYEVYFALAESLVAQGHALVLDNPVFWPRVEQRWLELAARAGSPALLIECVCPDDGELLRRVETRDALPSQPRARLDLASHPGASPAAFQPRLVLDTTRRLNPLIEDAIRYIEQQRAAAAVTREPGLAREAVR